jgi:hypothetical protein
VPTVVSTGRYGVRAAQSRLLGWVNGMLRALHLSQLIGVPEERKEDEKNQEGNAKTLING